MSNSVEAFQTSVSVLVAATHSNDKNSLELFEDSHGKVLVNQASSKSKDLLELELHQADQPTVLASSASHSEEIDCQPQPTDQTEVLVNRQGLEEKKALELATSHKLPKELLPLLEKLTLSQMEDLQQHLDAALKACYRQLEELEKERQQLLSLGSIYPGEILPYSPSKTNAQGEKYNYYVFRAPTKCLPGPQGGLVKNIHLGKVHSPKYKRFKDMIARRERLAQIEKQVN